MAEVARSLSDMDDTSERLFCT